MFFDKQNPPQDLCQVCQQPAEKRDKKGNIIEICGLVGFTVRHGRPFDAKNIRWICEDCIGKKLTGEP